MSEKKYKCVCCGSYSLGNDPEDPSFEICPVCGWENDPSQNGSMDFAGGANKVSLNEARLNYSIYGVSSLTKQLERFIRYKETVRSVFKGEFDITCAVCAAMFLSRRAEPDAERLKKSKRYIKENSGVFSSFRGPMLAPAACILSLSGDPEGKMKRAAAAYKVLKEYFSGSEQMVLASLILSESVPEDLTREKAVKAKAIYGLMKEKHRLLTGREDSVFALLMALSEKSAEELIAEDEKCFELLKHTAGKDAVQTVSHILCLSEKTAEEKCLRFTSLFENIRNSGMKYGKTYELPLLASLSVNTAADTGKLVSDLSDADFFLSGRTGYKGIFGADKKTRLMHAALILSSLCAQDRNDNAVAVSSMISVVAAQIMAMMIVMTGSSVTASAIASN